MTERSEVQVPAEPDVAAPDQDAERPERDGTAEPADAAEMRDRWRRAAAEVENVRRRCERRLAECAARERARVATEWLPVLDNMERALSHATADPQAIVAGVAAVREQARAVLARLGITPIEDLGGPFDPARHEALRVVPGTDAEPGTVVEVLRPGFAAGDLLLRPAGVAVAGERPVA
jgi:molecular chaperone GrpE